MTTSHQPLTPEDAALYRDTLHELLAIGTDLARDIRSARKADAITPEQAACAFERIARATRRTVLLATRLGEHPVAGTQAARRAVIRAVEDAINRDPAAPTPEARQTLEHEFRERLDAPEFAEDLAARPVPEIIADILHDMDLGRPPYTSGRHFRRRTPEAIRRLHALARGEHARGEPARGEPAPPFRPTG